MRFLIPILLVLVTLSLKAQTKIPAVVPESYSFDLSKLASKENRKDLSKEEKKKAKEHRKKLKSELKLSGKLYRLKSDSLEVMRKILKDSSKRKKVYKARRKELKDMGTAELQKQESVQEIMQDENFTLGKGYYDKLSKRDTSAIVKELQTEAVKVAPVDQEYLSELNKLKESDWKLDSAYKEPPQFVNELFEEEFGALGELQALQSEFESTVTLLKPKSPKKEVEGVMGQDMMKQLRENKALGFDQEIKKYEDHFSINPEILAKAKEAATVAKKKRSAKEVIKSLVNQDMKSKDLGLSVKERFYLAGFIEIKNTSPLLISVNPTVGYRFTERITMGIGGNVRFYPDKFDKLSPDNGYAAQLFLDYRIAPSFFIHTEVEESRRSINMEQLRSSITSYRVGVGKELNYRNRAKANILLLYQISSSEPGSVNIRERISVRTGFIIN